MTAPLKEPLLLTPLDIHLLSVTEYAHRLFFFPNSVERDAIAQHMRNAFAQMMDAIPWTAGSVTHINHEHQHGMPLQRLGGRWKTF